MITREEITKIARLAKLSVAEENLDALTASMAEIIAFADTVNAAGVPDEAFDTLDIPANAYREDTVTPSYDRERILANVHGGEDGFFPVKKYQR